MPWNLHEKCPGQFDFESDNLDFAEYFKIAQDLEVNVICRPSPGAVDLGPHHNHQM